MLKVKPKANFIGQFKKYKIKNAVAVTGTHTGILHNYVKREIGIHTWVIDEHTKNNVEHPKDDSFIRLSQTFYDRINQ